MTMSDDIPDAIDAMIDACEWAAKSLNPDRRTVGELKANLLAAAAFIDRHREEPTPGRALAACPKCKLRFGVTIPVLRGE